MSATHDKGSAPEKRAYERPAPSLIPPDARLGEEKRPPRTALLLILVCGLFLVAAALLVVFLPLQQESPTSVQPVEPQQAPRPPTQSAPTFAETSREQVTPGADWSRELDRLMTLWLQKQAEAEAVNIGAWGGDTYDRAVALARECDRLFESQDYPSAKQACEGAIETLDELMASQELLLEEAVAAGLLALQQGDPEASASYFEKALALDPADRRAQAGAHRAGQLPAVLDALQAGQALEDADQLDDALRAYTEALTLDPDFARAQEAQARVRTIIAGQAFQQAMGRALQAMADGKLAQAQSALQQAEKIRPGDRAVLDLKLQLADAQRTARLNALRRDAEKLEQAERWPEALSVCQEALKLDPQAAFASSCQTRASLRVDLDKQLKAVFARPERLFENGPLQEARQVRAYAAGMTPRGPLLAAQLDQLDALIAQAEAEVDVVLLSDGLTQVVIYHVGRLGVFQEKTLLLRTGDYTATGSRDGFRDVRQTLRVRPGAGKMVFTIRCEEPI